MSATKTERAALPQPVPTTISGLWALHPLTPIATSKAYETASDLCTGLAVRRLNAVQREYFRELTALVEAYEDAHGTLEKTERQLRKLAEKRQGQCR